MHDIRMVIYTEESKHFRMTVVMRHTIFKFSKIAGIEGQSVF